MYSIGEIAKLTGLTAYTLRYYEKIGLLPSPNRQDGKPDGIRLYEEQDLHYIRFIHGLKHTGIEQLNTKMMQLESVKEIAVAKRAYYSSALDQ